MNTKLREINLRSYDKWHAEEKDPRFNDIEGEYRISIYFDYSRDNYHIQFAKDADKKTVANLLNELADLILKGDIKK